MSENLVPMAMYQLPPPEQMKRSGDLAHNWKIFRELFTDYATATELTKKSDEIQVATLKAVMGTECKQVLKRLNLTSEALEKTSTILENLERHFAPERNILYERYIFHSAKQQPKETVDQYLLRLRRLAEPRKFTVLHDEMLRDRLVLGARDKAARARLFREKECSLAKAVESLRISEVTLEQLMVIGDKEDETVNAVSEKPRRRVPEKTVQKKTIALSKSQPQSCRYCGGKRHQERQQCPAYGKYCRNCGKPNHFQSVCRLQPTKKVHVVMTEHSDSESDDSLYQLEEVGAVNHQQTKQFFTVLQIQEATGETEIQCQLDTGATCNFMAINDLCCIKQQGDPQMDSSTAKLKLYDGTIIPVLGEINLQCKANEKQQLINFEIIPGKQKPLLSGHTCLELGLISINCVHAVDREDTLLADYKDVFEGLGCLTGNYHIEIDHSVPPVQHAPRRTPVALKKRLKQKIDEMEQKGIIAKVDKPTAWISSLVAVVKPNKVRVCIDPRDLNKAIQRPKYQIPTLEEILPQLAEAKIFSVLDAKDGFHQVKLDESSSHLTTFWTPFGCYSYLRMPFGISSAPEEFQRRMHLIIEGLPGVAVIADDILVYGCGSDYVADHDANLRRLLQRARESNLKLNKKKLRLRLEEVAYMGHLLTNKGLQPDPMKVKAIEALPQPSDKKSVERLLGFVKYLSRFLPNLAEVVAPLRKLTEKEVPFYWESQQQEAFDQVKKLVTSAPVLKFYNIAEEVTLQCDTSDKGLGATLLQNGQPVAFASKALTG